MRVAPNCAKKCEKRLVVRICAENGLDCDYVRETAKSAIPHTPHLNITSDFNIIYLQRNANPAPEKPVLRLLIPFLHLYRKKIQKTVIIGYYVII